MKRTSLSTLLIMLISLGNVFAQGTIRGKIIDKSTGEELIGAAVLVVGTTRGASTDLDGNYSIDNIPNGKYELRVSFISYETQTITGVTLNGGVEVLNFNLSPVSQQITGVIITAKAVQNNEAAIRTVQRKAATVVDGIGARQMSQVGEGDAAGALKRVTGITVEGGKYVYVRGLGDRYSKSVLNGAEIPGLDPERNSVQMDLFPANIIDNVIVHKTYSPELPGSFTGGYVNVITKDFPEKFTFQFSTSLGINDQSSFNSSYLGYEGSSTDWLGIDNGFRAIPDAALGELPSLQFPLSQNGALDAITKSFNKIWVPEEVGSFMNHSHGLSLGNQTKLFGKTLGYIASLSYSRKFEHYGDGEVGRYRLTGANSEQLNQELILDDIKSTGDVMIGAMLALTLKLNNNHKVGLNILHNQSGITTSRAQSGRKPSDDPDMFYETQTIQFQERAFTSYQFKGEHLFRNAGNLHFEWMSSYTSSGQDEPDLRFFTNDYFVNGNDTNYNIQVTLYPLPTRFYREMDEINFDNKLDFALPFQLNGKESKLKFGTQLTWKVRSFVEKRFQFNDQYGLFDGDVADYMKDDNMGPVSGTYGIYVLNSKDDDDKNSYDATQSIYSGYLMADMPITSQLRIIAGARLEKTIMDVTSRNPIKEPGHLDNLDILPALNITYGLIEDTMNVRFGFSRTLARPTFRELAPYASFNFVGDYVIVGNNELERTLITNIDLRWEYYMTSREIISFSAFYKDFINPIERTFNPEAGNDELTWRNVDQAKVYGVEAELSKRLSFINALRNYQLSLNASLVRSVVTIDEKELQTIQQTEPEYPSTTQMFGQSPFIVNGLLAYVNDSLGLNFNLSYNIFGKRLVTVILGGTPNIYEQPRGLMNFNIGKSIGDNLSLKFSVNNILNSEYRKVYTRYNEQDTWKNLEYTYAKYTLGRTFSLGITYKL